MGIETAGQTGQKGTQCEGHHFVGKGIHS
jgi:hypothetical protein